MKHFPLKKRRETNYNVGVSTGRVAALFSLYPGNFVPCDRKGRVAYKRKGEDEMRKYKSSGELETVICNCCGKRIAVKEGIAREGVLKVEYMWDYFSEKDGDVHRFDLCEECYDEMISGFRVQVEVEEAKELL